MSRHAMMFAIARRAASASTGKYRLGCVIAQGKRVIGVGTNNMEKTHPMISKNTYKTIHAEVDAVIGVPRDQLRGAVAYVYRERADGSLGMAMPCKDCACILASLGVRIAYYSDPLAAGGFGKTSLRKS